MAPEQILLAVLVAGIVLYTLFGGADFGVGVWEFSTAFHEADVLLLTEIYAASENPIEGISGSALLQEIKRHGQKNAHFVAEVGSLPRMVQGMILPGDIVLTLGAGNIHQAGEELLQKLEQGHAAC